MKIDLNAYPLPTRNIDGKLFLWDPIRKKSLLPRPEECLRQLLISFLLYDVGFPRSLVGVEAALKIPGSQRAQRMDVVVYEAGTMVPLILFELKRPGIKIAFKVFSQLQKYASVIGARQWVGVGEQEMIVFSNRGGAFKEESGIRHGADDRRPGFNKTAWRKILNEKEYEKDPGEWARIEFQNGLIGNDHPAVSLAGLRMARLLRDKESLVSLFANKQPSILLHGTELLAFDSLTEQSHWNNVFRLAEIEKKQLALGVGLDRNGLFHLRAVIKEGEKYRFFEKKLLEHISTEESPSAENILQTFMADHLL